MSFVSIIIPSYNSFSTIGFTLKGIQEQSRYDQILEIIVVDSSEDEQTQNFLYGFEEKKLKVIISGKRIMPAIQRNIGARNANGQVYLFIDSDAFPCNNWVENVVKAYIKGIRLGGGGYKVPVFQTNNKVALAQFYFEFNEFIEKKEMSLKRMLPSCNLFCDKDIFKEVGGFPEIRAAEDTLFCLTAGKKSNLTFLPDTFVYHIFKEEKAKYYMNQLMIGEYAYHFRTIYFKNYFYNSRIPRIIFPFIYVFKMGRILCRVTGSGGGHLLKLLKSFRYFISGSLYWSKGFLIATKKPLLHT